jgi:hypothetical protein
VVIAAAPSPEVLRILKGPIFSTLVRQSMPNIPALAITMLVGIAETYYVSRKGIWAQAKFGAPARSPALPGACLPSSWH